MSRGKEEQPTPNQAAPYGTEAGPASAEQAPPAGASSGDELAKMKLLAAENWDRYLRARADLENYKSRVQRDLAANIRYGKKDLFKRMIVAIDNLERAVAGWRQAGVPAAQVEGVEIIHRQLLAVLAADGVAPMEVVGKPFDPTLHDAVVAWENPDVKVETVSDELEKGYTYEGEVLRPAKVRVARPA